MNTSRICKQCQKPVPEGAPEGLCPECLARMALGSEPQMSGARVPPEPADLGKQFPQLEILEMVGMGGMGMVYKARQPKLDRFVALKIMPIVSDRGAAFGDRFAREARALARLNHSGIVAVYDYGQTIDFYYFVMEYVDGMNLRQLLEREPVSPRQALGLVVQICTALQYAHDENIVHRDIKPANILINKNGQAKIADFGLAKLLGNTTDPNLTETQTIMGTMNYMAPEQRDKPLEVDHRADIYSLGVVLYEMLTGEVPMGRFDPPSQKVQIDVRLDEVVLRALDREPSRRYQKASDIKTGVETIAATMKAGSSWPVLSDLSLTLGSLALGACGYFLFQPGEVRGWTAWVQCATLMGLMGALVWRMARAISGGIVAKDMPPVFRARLRQQTTGAGLIAALACAGFIDVHSGAGRFLGALFNIWPIAAGALIAGAAACFLGLARRIFTDFRASLDPLTMATLLKRCRAKWPEPSPLTQWARYDAQILSGAALAFALALAVVHGKRPFVTGGLIREGRASQSPFTVEDRFDRKPGEAGGPVWRNSLGMGFTRVAGTPAWFSIWDTRVRDFAAFADDTGYQSTAWSWSGRHLKRDGNGWLSGHWVSGGWKNPELARGPYYPACGMSWIDAQAFCHWLTEKEHKSGLLKPGLAYRLPTEDEWSVVFGGTQYPWGNQWPPPTNAGNYAGWTTTSGSGEETARTTPVGSFRPDAFGLYDVGGNVWQWSEELGGSAQIDGVLRGGAWSSSSSTSLLSSNHEKAKNDDHYEAYGFRCVIAPIVTEPKSRKETAGQSVQDESKTSGSYAETLKAAEAGEEGAQNTLGRMYEQDVGTNKSYSDALYWYRKAAQSGRLDASASVSRLERLQSPGNSHEDTMIGFKYDHGDGVKQNFTEAARWFRKAAEAGNSLGQFWLGEACAFGRGVDEDLAEGARWHRKSAEAGNTQGEDGLGFDYEHGRGVAQDYAEAARWYRKAAEGGFTLSQVRLGNLYENGLGVPKDIEQAAKWYRKAADAADSVGRENLARLSAQMDQEKKRTRAISPDIHTAARDGDLETVRALLTSNPTLLEVKDQEGDSPLLWAACRDQKPVVEFLLAHNALVDARDKDGDTPLLWAACRGYNDVAQLLLATRAEVDARDNDGKTPLHWAASRGFSDTAALLLASNAAVNARDNEGDSPLLWAACKGYKEVAELLLAHHAVVDAPDRYGKTPLHWAADRDYQDVAQVLLAHGANTNATDKDGQTPLQVAEVSGHHDMAEFLRNPARPRKPASRKVQLKFVSVDSEDGSALWGRGANAVDDNPETFWHTRWQGKTSVLPHQIIIELVPPSIITGFTYLPRQDGQENGTIKDYEFYVSDHSQDFGPPVKKGVFDSDTQKKSATFPPVECRFFKLKALSEMNAGPWTSAAEIGVIQDGAATPGQSAGTKNPPGAEILSTVNFDSVVLQDALNVLARQAGLNIMFDPAVPRQKSADGTALLSSAVTAKWKNVTAIQALAALLDNYGWQMKNDTSTPIVRICPKDAGAPSSETFDLTAPAQGDDNVPQIRLYDIPLTAAANALATQAGLNIQFDPRLTKAPPSITMEWKNVTARQALQALLKNENLEATHLPGNPLLRLTYKNP